MYPLPVESSVAGGCSSCSSRDPVWQIYFGTLQVRVCIECRTALATLLKVKPVKITPVTLDFKEVKVPTDPPLSAFSLRGTSDSQVWFASFRDEHEISQFLDGFRFASHMLYNDIAPNVKFAPDSFVKKLRITSKG